jgi:hypothetical protein
MGRQEIQRVLLGIGLAGDEVVHLGQHIAHVEGRQGLSVPKT